MYIDRYAHWTFTSFSRVNVKSTFLLLNVRFLFKNKAKKLNVKEYVNPFASYAVCETA